MRRGERSPKELFRRDYRSKQECVSARPWRGSGLSSGGYLPFAGLIPIPQPVPDPSSGPHTAPPVDLI
jgi:hypothetical protein